MAELGLDSNQIVQRLENSARDLYQTYFFDKGHTVFKDFALEIASIIRENNEAIERHLKELGVL